MPTVSPAEVRYQQGGAFKLAGRLDEALVEFEAALKADPGMAAAKYSIGTILLAKGDFERGFALYEARHEVEVFRNIKPKLPYPEWQGEDVAGREFLIWPEQGFGDQIQFARFAPMLAERGAHVTLVCAPALERLFAPLGVDVIPAKGAISFPDPDYWSMCMALAGRMGVTLETLAKSPYLRGTAAPRADRFRIGIVTQGNPIHANDHMRSLTREDKARLADLPAEVVDLSIESTGAKDFQDTADIIAGLDLVISVDTSVAHLAGAMGKPCWVLVPAFNTDWRWLQGRIDSPWYSNMTLWRQAKPGEWGRVIENVRAAVLALADAAARS